MAARPERILLLQLKRIGDFILTAPAVAALRAAKPDAEIVMVVPANAAELARCFPGVSRVLRQGRGLRDAKTWAGIAAGPWDACLDFAGTDRSAAMAKLSRATVRAGFGKFAGSQAKRLAYTVLSDASVRDLHTVDFHGALLDCVGIRPQAGMHGVFALPDGMAAAAAERLRSGGIAGSYAVVHPGTARAEKLWLADRWAEVIAGLVRHRGLPVVMTGSDDGIESAHLAELRKRLTVPVFDLAGKLSLIETAAMIAGASFAIGVDSMAMHLAAMFERPQIVLFGPTNPFHWRPRHDGAVVLAAGHEGPALSFSPRDRGGDMKLISTQQVMDAINTALPPGGPACGSAPTCGGIL